MSYEGYDLFVCPEGHRWSYDVYEAMEDETRSQCPYCQKEAAWWCGVDQTNCDYEEPELEIAHPPPTCECCGQTTGPARYKIPGPEVTAKYVGPPIDNLEERS